MEFTDDALAQPSPCWYCGSVERDEDGECAACHDPHPKQKPNEKVKKVAKEPESVGVAAENEQGLESIQGDDVDTALPDKSWDLPRLGAFIIGGLRRTAEEAHWIGRALDLARKKHTADRDWLVWLREIGISKSSAYRYLEFCTGYIERRLIIGLVLGFASCWMNCGRRTTRTTRTLPLIWMAMTIGRSTTTICSTMSTTT